MGDFNVRPVRNQHDKQIFMKNLLKDMQALEHMVQNDWFEKDPIRIGAEQEMCLVDQNWKPYPINKEALAIISDDSFTSELAKFNMEVNLKPLPFTEDSISQMHQNLKESLDVAQEKVEAMGAMILLTGILPTIRKKDVDKDNLTDEGRYEALMDQLKDLRGNKAFELRISGVDELNFKHESAMLEACNTSFQVHLQVTPETFPQRYNFAQALAGPVMAVSVNSPLLFGRRLWKETRIALFQQSIDTRTLTDHFRERSPRVTFGDKWIKDSILEIYQDDISRFKILLVTDVEEDVIEQIKNKTTPKLRALNIHNSTVYRWNRPCYGISPNGQPHLRIENRIFPSGPSLPDAMANAAFWLGLMNGMEDEIKDISKELDFSDVRTNFFAASRFGMDTRLTWLNGEKISPRRLILEQLLPVARHGLEKADIYKSDIDLYLGIIEQRVDSGQTGSSWMLKSYSKLKKEGFIPEEIISAITASVHNEQSQDKPQPVHEWKLAEVEKFNEIQMYVEEFMETDLITVQSDVPLDFAANIMVWRRIRHLPVEDDEGKLVGLLTASQLLKYFSQREKNDKEESIPSVESIMVKMDQMKSVAPGDPILHAMDIIQKQRVGCLPVSQNGELIGILSESTFPNIVRSLIKRPVKRQKENADRV